MSETKWTPGPWRWWTSNSWRRLTAHNLPGGQFEQEGNVLCPIVSRDGHPDLKVSMANSALIAAAPELYEALKAITDCFGVGYVSAEKFVEDVTELMHEGRAALSRARGEAQ